MFHNNFEYKLPPQSTFRVVPEMKDAPGDRRKQTADETSSGTPVRLQGMNSLAASKTSKPVL